MAQRLFFLRFMAHQVDVPSLWVRSDALAGRILQLDAGRHPLFSTKTVECKLLGRDVGDDRAVTSATGSMQ
jgi:hypothetical protein